MVEVFKTDVGTGKAAILLTALFHAFPQCRISFDLEDCDRILRLEGDNICSESVIRMLAAHDCSCEALE